MGCSVGEQTHGAHVPFGDGGLLLCLISSLLSIEPSCVVNGFYFSIEKSVAYGGEVCACIVKGYISEKERSDIMKQRRKNIKIKKRPAFVCVFVFST